MALIVYVTIPQNKAKSLAKLLVSKKVCACVNIVSKVESYFWWQKKIDQAKEALLIIKTQNDLYRKLEQVVKKNHPYKVPEIIAFKISQGNPDYLKWIKESCK